MGTTIDKIIKTVTDDILWPIITLLIVLATVSFMFGAVKLLFASKEPKKLEEGRKFIIYGLLGLFTIVAMWGLVTVIKRTFNLSETKIPKPENLPK